MNSTTRTESALRAAAAHVDWPVPEPNLGDMVIAGGMDYNIEPMRASRRMLVAVAAGIVIVALALTPTGRQAVAEAFAIFGVELSIGDGDADRRPLGFELELGTPLADATGVPVLDGRRPSAAYTSGSDRHYVWAPADGAADIGGTGVGTLLSRFAGLDLAVQKQVADQTGVSLVDVRGGTGLLLSGPGHTVVFRTSAGEFREEATRRSTNALLWNEGGNVYRLEAALDAAALLRLAESLDLAG